MIFYIHGVGWAFGSFHTHEKLVRELCARTNSFAVFPEYSRSPEAKYPTAIEQCYFILSHLWEIIGKHYPMIDHHTLTVSGDSECMVIDHGADVRDAPRPRYSQIAVILSGDQCLF